MMIPMDDGLNNRSASTYATSADADALILVDASDRELGYLSKERCHEGRGILHRAFSLLIFNDAGELLLQQRSAHKRLWPLYWSNSCCSHPRRYESVDTAIKRRLYEELGVSCALRFLYKFEYQAQFDANGAEHELCSVFVGHCTERLQINLQEIHNWRWISQEALQAEMERHGAAKFTPWFRLEWAQIQRDHRAALSARNDVTIGP
jgi:isopentenyl-diphosphate delta-isomerase